MALIKELQRTVLSAPGATPWISIDSLRKGGLSFSVVALGATTAATRLEYADDNTGTNLGLHYGSTGETLNGTARRYGLVSLNKGKFVRFALQSGTVTSITVVFSQSLAT